MTKLFKKYREVLIYIICSVTTAIIEMIIGYLLIKALPNIVVTNTISILISSVIHYFITLKFAFKQKSTVISVVIYVVTFVFGIILQDLVIALFYNYLLAGFGEFIRYTASKVVSLGIPFIVIYLLRSFLNKKYNKEKEELNK